jgi:hypothetical protein
MLTGSEAASSYAMLSGSLKHTHELSRQYSAYAPLSVCQELPRLCVQRISVRRSSEWRVVRT